MASRIKQTFGISTPTPEERKKALEEPGPGWKEWALTRGLKEYVGLGFLIVDVLVLVSIIETRSPWAPVGGVAFIALAFYLEFLAWMCLWRHPLRSELRPGGFQRGPFRPVMIGRWTREYTLWKSGALSANEEGIDAQEFT